jgi:hypothetical protein
VRLCLALVVLVLSSTDGRSQPAKAGAASVREFDAICARCHAEIFQRYIDTRMANASEPAAEGIEPGTFAHRASGVHYRVFVENGSPWLGYAREGDPSIHGRKRLEYFLGSGNHGRTYLYSTGRYWFETPIAWYARKHGYDMRPAYLDDKEMPLNLPMTSGCLRCHATGVQREEPGTRNRFAGIPFLHGGIACENCHGDASAHAATSGKAAVINPAKLDPERRDSVCIVCHLEGETSVPRLGHSLLDFRPGDRAGEYASGSSSRAPEPRTGQSARWRRFNSAAASGRAESGCLASPAMTRTVLQRARTASRFIGASASRAIPNRGSR